VTLYLNRDNFASAEEFVVSVLGLVELCLWFAEDVAPAPSAVQFAQQCAQRGQYSRDAVQAAATLLLPASLDAAVRAAEVHRIAKGSAGTAGADDQ
jgi:hypothetical protein